MYKNKVKIKILNDKFNNKFFLISIYNKYNYKQYIIKKSIAYTFFIIISFLYKYGFINIK